MNPISLTITIYLGVGLLLAGLAFSALALLRKIGEPDRATEMQVESMGWPILFVGLVIAWPAALIIMARRNR